MGAESLHKEERLHSFGAIRRLFTEGRGGFVYPLRYMVYAEDCDSPLSAEVLFSTPKKFHKRANRRNTLRRRMREAYRLNKSLLLNRSDISRHLQIALVYSSKEILDYKTIEHATKRILQNIHEQL
jgi:ribonuclease P protein component